MVKGPRAKPVPEVVKLELTAEAKAERLAAKGCLRLHLQRAEGLQPMDANGKADPYVVALLGKKERKSGSKWGTLDPVWEETLEFDKAPQLEKVIRKGLRLQLKDEDKGLVSRTPSTPSLPLGLLRASLIPASLPQMIPAHSSYPPSFFTRPHSLPVLILHPSSFFTHPHSLPVRLSHIHSPSSSPQMDSDDLIGKLKVSLESLTDHNSMVFEESLRPQGSLHFWITWIPEAGKASGGSGGGGSPGAKAAPLKPPKGGAKAKPKGSADEEPAASAREPAMLDDDSPDPKPKKASKKAKA